MTVINHRSKRRSAVVGIVLAMLVAAMFASPAVAASLSVRLEAGPHTGYHLSSGGAVTATKSVTLTGPRTVTANLRHRVGSGIYLRLTSGALSGWQVLESAMNYVPSPIGRILYSPARTVTLAAGRYLGYRFYADGSLASTRYATLASSTSATTDKRAVIDGRVYARMTSGAWAGYYLPIAGPYALAAERIRCETPMKVAAGSNELLTRVAATTATGQIALTFDLGGRTTPALDILERLVIDRVCATIFPTGATAATAAGTPILEMIAAHPELFEIGNHTVHHCNLRDGGGGGSSCPATPPNAGFIASELNDADATFGAVAGLSSQPYWRPPYGAQNLSVRTAAGDAGYTKTVMWDIDTIDWRPIANDPPGPTPAAIAQKVVTNAKSGSIVLMHLGGYHTFDALPSMVTRLRADGLQPTSISGLLH